MAIETDKNNGTKLDTHVDKKVRIVPQNAKSLIAKGKYYIDFSILHKITRQ